jgi:ubiquinone/menaquinone biosynthesis C-methylase UbiE
MESPRDIEKYKRLMPVRQSWELDNRFRSLVLNPRKVLRGRIKEGMVVLEFGCGPGFFTPEIARMVGKSGKVIAADLQEGMLQKVRTKIEKAGLEERVMLHKCGEDRIGFTGKVDSVLAFDMMHEVADKKQILSEMKSLLKPDGRLYIIEQLWHPPKKDFEETANTALHVGFRTVEKPNVFMQRAIVFEVEGSH